MHIKSGIIWVTYFANYDLGHCKLSWLTLALIRNSVFLLDSLHEGEIDTDDFSAWG